MQRIAFLFAIFLVIGQITPGNAQSGLSQFYLEYAIVGNMKKKGGQQLQSLLDFAQENPKAANSLADFWWAWAIRECIPHLKDSVERASKIQDKAKLTIAQKDITEQRDFCVQSFIFDRWNDIQTSIENKRYNFKDDKK